MDLDPLRANMEGTEVVPNLRTAIQGYLAFKTTLQYRGDSKLRTHTALGPYGRSIRRSIGPSYGWCVCLNSSNSFGVIQGSTLVLGMGRFA